MSGSIARRFLKDAGLVSLSLFVATLALVDTADFLGFLGPVSAVPRNWQGPYWSWVVYVTIVDWFSTFWFVYGGAGTLVAGLGLLLRSLRAPPVVVVASASLLTGCAGFLIVGSAAALSLSVPLSYLAPAAGLLGLAIGGVIAQPSVSRSPRSAGGQA